MIDGFTMRFATANDIATILRHRSLMISEMRGCEPSEINEYEPHFVDWVTPRIANGEFVGFLACDGDIVVAGAAIWIMDWPRGPMNVDQGRPYIFNVYTEIPYRRKGLAHGLIEAVIDYCKDRNYPIIELHASEAGRPIYESLGFNATNQMRLYANA